jgi:hypothetical protein
MSSSQYAARGSLLCKPTAVCAAQSCTNHGLAGTVLLQLHAATVANETAAVSALCSKRCRNQCSALPSISSAFQRTALHGTAAAAAALPTLYPSAAYAAATCLLFYPAVSTLHRCYFATQLVEGFTFLDHFGRTYPNMFVHKCQHCNGAGSVTCPHCQGYKLKQGASAAAGLRLGDAQGRKGQLMLQQSSSELQPVDCRHCGAYCDWDHESEWDEK